MIITVNPVCVPLIGTVLLKWRNLVCSSHAGANGNIFVMVIYMCHNIYVTSVTIGLPVLYCVLYYTVVVLVSTHGDCIAGLGEIRISYPFYFYSLYNDNRTKYNMKDKLFTSVEVDLRASKARKVVIKGCLPKGLVWILFSHYSSYQRPKIHTYIWHTRLSVAGIWENLVWYGVRDRFL